MSLDPVGLPCARLQSCWSNNPAQNKKGSSVDYGEPFFLAPRIAGFALIHFLFQKLNEIRGLHCNPY